MNTHAVRLIQISDVHLFADPEKELLGVKTQQSLSAVISLLRKETVAPQLVIVSGDLSQDYTEQSYLHFVDLFKTLPCPVHVVPGNHDDATVMAKVFPNENIMLDKHIVLNNWQIILLDSHQHKQVPGHLSDRQLDFMEHCLKNYPDHHAIVLFHHHPVKMNAAWLDPLGLQNAEDFWKIAEVHAHLKVVLFGHVHQEHSGQKHHIHYFSTPSTCIQFKPNVEDFALDFVPPGYRWIDLFTNGSIKTGVARVDQYIGVFDRHSKGY